MKIALQLVASAVGSETPRCITAAAAFGTTGGNQAGAKADQPRHHRERGAVAVVSALDHRFGWSSVPTAVVVVGDVLVAVGIGLAYAVINQNNYAAATITVEVGQPVVSTGAYGVVRHPMYVGALTMTIGTPLALGSCWGLLVVVAGVSVFVARILDEERALRQDLEVMPNTWRRFATDWCRECGDRPAARVRAYQMVCVGVA